MIMELLLINHPLDCPVCDQAGMCGLQDYSYEYGQSVHQFVEARNVNPRKDVSEQIQLNQDRCIMCTRCVQFAREITHGRLQVMRRGDHAEIAVFPDNPLDNPLAGNVVDLCPVGALLDKDFLHKQRFWFTTKHDTVCTRCSTGCGTVSEENRGALWRFRPRNNPHVNDYWICDEGRYGYKAANDPNLLGAMYLRKGLAGGRPRPTRPSRRSPRELGQGGGKVAAADLAVQHGRGGVPPGQVHQGPGPGPCPGDRPGARLGRGPRTFARPRAGADRRHLVRNLPAVHDRRGVPEPGRRRGHPEALPGK
ncbi:MAG: hypothetical protein U0800_10430 [Isosphaeraceae bacterium]